MVQVEQERQREREQSNHFFLSHGSATATSSRLDLSRGRLVTCAAAALQTPRLGICHMTWIHTHLSSVGLDALLRPHCRHRHQTPLCSGPPSPSSSSSSLCALVSNSSRSRTIRHGCGVQFVVVLALWFQRAQDLHPRVKSCPLPPSTIL